MIGNVQQADSIDKLLGTIGELWNVETGYPGFRAYSFSFSERDASELLLNLVLEFADLGKYKVIKGAVQEAHRELYVEFAYKEDQKSRNGIQGLLQEYKKDENREGHAYFARTYIVKPDSDEITRYSRKNPPIPDGNKVLVIDVRTDEIHREAVNNFGGTFHLVYNNHFKTPSKT